MSDEFEEIIANQPEEPMEEARGTWDVIAQTWPKFHNSVLVKGLYIVEYVDEDGDRGLRFGTSPEAASWDILGMMRRCVLDVESEAMSMYDLVEEGEEEGEDDD